MMASFQRVRPFRYECNSKMIIRCVSTTDGSSGGEVTKVFRVPQFNKRRDGKGKPKGYFDVESRYSLEIGLKSGQPEKMLLEKPYIVLGIESSCDDTGVGIVTSDGKILSNVVYSQYAIHERFGGVVPSLAMEAHKNNINKAVDEAIIQAGLTSLDQVDAVAVTKGPGLEICLRVGLRKAQEIAREYKKPLVTVHHLEAHCTVARLAGQEILPESNALLSTSSSSSRKSSNNTIHPDPSSSSSSVLSSSTTTTTIIANTDKTIPFTPKVKFPFLTLLVSGGHTSILLCRGIGDHLVLGGTLDDALGEAFDKVARMLGLKSEKSGGAAVEQQAEDYFKYFVQKSNGRTSTMITDDGSGGKNSKNNDISSSSSNDNSITHSNSINNNNSSSSSSSSSSGSSRAINNNSSSSSSNINSSRAMNNTSAAQGMKSKHKAITDLNLTVPMRDKPNCDFSYAGLKNGFRMAVMNTRRNLGLDVESTNAPASQMESISDLVSLPPEATALLCAGFQDVAFQHVEDRIKRAFYALEKLHLLSSINALVVVGGVASNKDLRRRLLRLLEDKYEDELYTYDLHSSRLIANAAKYNNSNTYNNNSNSSNYSNNNTNYTNNSNYDFRRRGKSPKLPTKLPLIFPPVNLCTDNGVMIAWAGIEKLSIGISDDTEGQESIARWPIGSPVEDTSIDSSLFKK